MIKNLKMELLNSEEAKKIKGGSCGASDLFAKTCVTIEHRCTGGGDVTLECKIGGKYVGSCQNKHTVVVSPIIGDNAALCVDNDYQDSI